mmetsp:Transcript_9266/g.25015  ORF Transcript_9266/g.25015 Transcript_9266/m.25015 type:complete len:335 (+) Transcript_9266:1736-2740(+)
MTKNDDAHLHALLERIALPLEEEERETKVGNEDQDEADDHRARRAFADSFGTTRGGEAPTAADHRDYCPKHPRLYHTNDDVPALDGPRSAIENDVGAHPVHRLGQKHARRHAHREAQQVQHRRGDHAGQHPRCDEVVDRIRSQHPQAVRLLGHLLRSQFGRKRRAHPAGNDDARDHGRQLAPQRQRQHAAHRLRQPQLRKLPYELNRKHHADKRRRQQAHAQRLGPHHVQLVQRVPVVNLALQYSHHHLAPQDQRTQGPPRVLWRPRVEQEGHRGPAALPKPFRQDAECQRLDIPLFFGFAFVFATFATSVTSVTFTLPVSATRPPHSGRERTK